MLHHHDDFRWWHDGERNEKVKTRVEFIDVAKGLAIVVTLAFVIGCSRTDSPATGVSRQIRTVADLKGARVAMFSNDFHKKELKELQPEMVVEMRLIANHSGKI